MTGTIKLSPREVEVLTLSAQGKTRTEISHMLVISEETVKEYTQAACLKLGASNKTQASIFALLLGLISPYRPSGLAENSIIIRKKSKKSPHLGDTRNFQEQLSRKRQMKDTYSALMSKI